MFTKAHFVMVFAAVTLTACGGGDKDSDSAFLPGSSNVGGIWTGTVTDEGGGSEEIYGIVTEGGDFRFISDAGVQYVGEITGDGTPFAGTFGGVTELGTEYCAGVSTSAGQILSGSVNKGSRLRGETLSRISCPGELPFRANFDLTYNSLYERDSSFGAVAGDYVDTATGDSITIYNTGAVYSPGDVTGCLAEGSIEPVNPRFNVYTITLQYTCAGAPRDGLAFEGLATLDGTDLIAGVSTATASLVLILDRS